MKENIFEVIGPFEISYERQQSGQGKRIDKEHVRSFWDNITENNIQQKQGCYIFALRAGKGSTPWYVGKTKSSLHKECFHSHKLNLYNKALFKGNKGTPVLFFVVPDGKKTNVSAKTLKDMEKYLIQTAYFKNPKLLNTNHTKNLPKWGIKGVIRYGKGKPNATSKNFRTMMGL